MIDFSAWSQEFYEVVRLGKFDANGSMTLTGDVIRQIWQVLNTTGIVIVRNRTGASDSGVKTQGVSILDEFLRRLNAETVTGSKVHTNVFLTNQTLPVHFFCSSSSRTPGIASGYLHE